MDYDQEVLEFLNDIEIYNYFNNAEMIDLVDAVEPAVRKYKFQQRIDPFEIYDEGEF